MSYAEFVHAVKKNNRLQGFFASKNNAMRNKERNVNY